MIQIEMVKIKYLCIYITVLSFAGFLLLSCFMLQSFTNMEIYCHF